jgi:hypothetical protein
MTDMKNLLRYNKPILCVVIFLIIIYIIRTKNIENFIDKIMRGIPLANAHGAEPPGFTASPGRIEQEQNMNATHVNPMYKEGNPQNINPEYKRQPM